MNKKISKSKPGGTRRGSFLVPVRSNEEAVTRGTPETGFSVNFLGVHITGVTFNQVLSQHFVRNSETFLPGEGSELTVKSVMIAFTFPGQGSQSPGMGAAWKDHPSWELVAEAADVAERDVEHLLLTADQEELTETRNAQLATFLVSMIVLDAIERTGVQPAILAGHSLGEYSALTATGVLSFEDGVRLVTERGNAMQIAAEESQGTMAAVLGLDDESVDLACRRTDGDVWVANYNAAGQVVIAGSPSAIDEAAIAAKELGAKRTIPIKVGGAFHTPFMSPARDRLRKAISEADLRTPTSPVFANVDAEIHTGSDEWASLLGAQLTSPVQWRKTLLGLEESGASVLLEIGPGKALSGMAKRTVPGITTASINSPDAVDSLLETLSSIADGATPALEEGEKLYAVERLVVSPGTGIFTPHESAVLGTDLAIGQLVGKVGDMDIHTPFAGNLQGLLALSGERVATSQPIAWLRAATSGHQ